MTSLKFHYNVTKTKFGRIPNFEENTEIAQLFLGLNINQIMYTFTSVR